MCGKTGCSGGKSNGTVFFTIKKEYLQRYTSFLRFTGIIGILLFHLRRRTSAMFLDQLSDGGWVNTRFVCGKNVLFHLAENSHRFSRTNGKCSWFRIVRSIANSFPGLFPKNVVGSMHCRLETYRLVSFQIFTTSTEIQKMCRINSV